MRNIICSVLLLLLFVPQGAISQDQDFTAVRGEVDFSQPIRDWDGFGFNYVETSQTTDYSDFVQEYGGFSLLDEAEKQEIIDLVFGQDGLKVGLVKMFLDPWHQSRAGGSYDHKTTTQHMRYFVSEGLKKTRSWGGDLEIITTLYGPPAYMTKQKVTRGRDFDPAFKEEMADYLVDWVRYLREEENLPVKYVSLHNEGEDWYRWPSHGEDPNIGDGHDYNMYWPPELVAEMVIYLREKLDQAGLNEVGVTNGEPSNWYRFSTWGYADVLYDNEEALNSLGIISSHGFYSGGYRNRWFGPHTSQGIDLLRTKRPDLHAWVTSTSWSNMDAKNIKEMHGNIYSSKVNGIIPWAGIQRPTHWVGGDPNPGSAFTVHEDGSYEVRRGYYFYKQVTRAGQPGMKVVRTWCMDSQLAVIGFAAGETANDNSLVIVNWSEYDKTISLKINGTDAGSFRYYTTNDKGDLGKKRYYDEGTITMNNEKLVVTIPAGSVMTFFESND